MLPGSEGFLSFPADALRPSLPNGDLERFSVAKTIRVKQAAIHAQRFHNIWQSSE